MTSQDQRPVVPPELVRHALRRTSARCYRLDVTEAGTSIALVMQVSMAGRRNAAEHVVDQLGEAGLVLRTEDPVADLATPDTVIPIEIAPR